MLLGPSGSLQDEVDWFFKPRCATRILCIKSPIYFSNLLLEFDLSMLDADFLGKTVTFKPPFRDVAGRRRHIFAHAPRPNLLQGAYFSSGGGRQNGPKRIPNMISNIFWSAKNTKMRKPKTQSTSPPNILHERAYFIRQARIYIYIYI